MQLVNGTPQGQKICPLGWNMLVMDHGGIVPGAPQQPANVAPSCVQEKCALWNEGASACSFAVMAVESQRRTDLAEEAAEARDAFNQGLIGAMKAAGVKIPGGVGDAPAAGSDRQLDGDADGGPSRN